MKLNRVHYRLLEHDDENQILKNSVHELDGSIILRVGDKPIEIECVQIGDDFGIQTHEPHTDYENLTSAKYSSIWQDLLGQNVSLDLDDSDCPRWVRIFSTEYEVYCSAYENGTYGGDQLYVSSTRPDA